MKMEIEDSRFIAGIYSTAKDKEETTLKKAFSLFLTIAIVFSLAACNQNEDKGKSASPPPESIAAREAPPSSPPDFSIIENSIIFNYENASNISI